MAREWTIRMQRRVTESNKGCDQGSRHEHANPEEWKSHELTEVITGRFTVGEDLP
jgi:hypothetical protein